MKSQPARRSTARSACADARRPELDAALVAGEAFRAIARRFAPLSRDAIRRHRPHVGTALVRAADARRGEEDESLLDKVRALEADAHRLKKKAEEQDDVRAALVAVDKLLDVIRLMHELAPSAADLAPVVVTLRFSDREITRAEMQKEPADG